MGLSEAMNDGELIAAAGPLNAPLNGTSVYPRGFLLHAPDGHHWTIKLVECCAVIRTVEAMQRFG